MPGRGNYWKPGGLLDGIIQIEDLDQNILSLISGGLGATIELDELNFPTNSLIHSDNTSTAEAIANVASGNVFLSQGVAIAPAWGKINNSHLSSGIFGNITGLGTQSQALNMGGFNITNVGFFESNAGNPSTVGAIRLGNAESIEWRNPANDGNIVLKGDSLNFLALSNTRGINLENDDSIRWDGNDLRRILNDTLGFQLSVEASDDIRFHFDQTDEYDFDETQADWKGNNLVNMGIFSFANTADSIRTLTDNMVFDVPATKFFDFRVGVVAQYSFGDGTANFFGNDVINLGFLEFDNISTPADPTSIEEGRMYLRTIDGSNNGLFIKVKQAGAIVEVKLS